MSQANRLLLIPVALALLLSARVVRGQTTAASELDDLAAISAAASEEDSGPAGIIPFSRGFNASVGTTSQHDSSAGWSSLLTPDVAYRLNQHFSVDAGVPIFLYINVDANVGTAAKPVYRYAPQQGVFGDTAVAFEGDAAALTVDYSGRLSLGLPSGNADYGLGAGQVTFAFNNHVEKSFSRYTPDVELGFADTSGLVDRRVLKSYIAVGPMAHFQAGTAVELSRGISFEAQAYEELPLAKNLLYSTTGKGKKKVTTSTNQDPVEDNGFLTSLDIPMSRHVILSGFYDRSLRDHDDTAGFSFTFLLRAPRAAEIPAR